MDNNRLPRDAAGSFELKEGTGGITAMCSYEDFLEVYKEDVTFHVRTPESIDPKRTNPRALFTAAAVDNVGSSSPVVARVLLQGRDILDSAMFERSVDKEGVVKVLYAIKESLVVCEKVARRVASHIDGILGRIQTVGLTPEKRGRALNPFPQVPELEIDATTFLIHAKRAIRSICELPSLFLAIKKGDSNFDKLLKALERSPSAPAPVVNCVRDNATPIRFLIELRNYQEHPGAKRTVIENFRLMPDSKIGVPNWYVSGNPPQAIRDDMLAAVEFLVQLTEVLLILLVIATVTKNIPYVVVQIEDAKVDAKKPIKYRLSVDIARMTGGKP